MIKGAIMVPHPPLIIPEVGRGQESIIDETSAAYDRAAEFAASLHPDTVVVASPHSIMYRDYMHISPGNAAVGDLGAFRAPQVRIKAEYDTEMVQRISQMAMEEGISAGTAGERDPFLDHGTLIPLYFLNRYLENYRVIRIGLSMLPFTEHYRLGMMIQKAADELGRNVVFIGSGDLSHKLQYTGPYGFVKEGPEYDRRIMEVCGSADFGKLLTFDEAFCEKAAECGHRSFCMMAGALDGLSLETEMLSHQDITGVGYGICTYRVTGTDEERRFLDV